MKTLLSPEELRDGVARLAAEVAGHYGDRPLTIVGVMTGSLVMLADMIRLLEMPLRIGLTQASSYRGGTRRGELATNTDWLIDVHGRDVLLVDDIFDTGHTLANMLEAVRARGAATVRSAVLLRKRMRCEVAVTPDHVAFDIPDEFVVGYGLDFQDEYRNLPFVAALEPQDIARHESRRREDEARRSAAETRDTESPVRSTGSEG